MKVTATEYDPKELATLTPDQYAAIEQVAVNRDADLGKEGGLEQLGLLLPAEGCVPDDWTDGDLLKTIRQKFAALLFPAMELAQKELQEHPAKPRVHWFLVVDADYEDTTHMAVIDAEEGPHACPYCYYHECEKAWNIGYENLASIANEVLRIKALLVERFMKVHRLE